MVEARTARRLSRARQLIDLGRWQGATAELGFVLAEDPRSVEALCMLGQSHLNLGEPVAACRAAEVALGVAPDHEWAHRVHSVALGMVGRHEDAVAAARQAVRLAPQHADSHQRLAHALLRLPGRAAEAREAAERAVTLAPHDAGAHVAVGLAAGSQGQRRAERDSYLRALQVDPSHATALNNLAAIDTERGRLGGASRWLTSALRSDPHHETALANLDVLAVHLLRRVTIVTVLGGLLVVLVAGVGSLSGTAAAPWVRAAVGAAVLAVCGLVAWATVRHLPAGARTHLRGLPRRLSGWDRALAVAFVGASVSLVGAALLPGDAAEGSAGVLVVVRIGWLSLVVGLAQAILGHVTGRR